MINRMYQLYELRDEIKIGIENLEKILPVEKEFFETLKNSGKYDKFEFMIKDWVNYYNNVPIQLDNLKFRLSIINELISDYEKHDNNSELIASTVTKVFESIGAVGQMDNKKDIAN